MAGPRRAAQDMGAHVHESQALLIEMIIGRTRSFYDFLAPRVEGLFHGLHNPVLSAENLHKIKTRVQPSVLRKKADELTYFFHMKHRFELERDLIQRALDDTQGNVTHAARKLKRGQILLAADVGIADEEIAASVAVECTVQCVITWRRGTRPPRDLRKPAAASQPSTRAPA